MQLVQLQNDLELLKREGYGLAALSYDKPAVLADFATRRGIQFPLLSDADSAVIRAYGVANREYRRGMGLDVEREVIVLDSAGYVPAYGMAYPAVFIVGRDGKVQWRAVSKGSELRLTGASILRRDVSDYRNVPAGRVRVGTASSNTSAGLGNRVRVSIKIDIPSGLHVYGPGATGTYRGVKWTLNESKCWIDGAPEWPRAAEMAMPFDEAKQPVYESTVTVSREVTVAPMLKAGDERVYGWFRANCLDSKGALPLAGVLEFQACDAKQCFPPQRVKLDWRFQFIEPDRVRVKPELRPEFQ